MINANLNSSQFRSVGRTVQCNKGKTPNDEGIICLPFFFICLFVAKSNIYLKNMRKLNKESFDDFRVSNKSNQEEKQQKKSEKK